MRKKIPYRVICNAKMGDEDALKRILKHYEPLIVDATKRMIRTEQDKLVEIVDEEMMDEMAYHYGKMYGDVAGDFKYPKNREFAVKNAYSECANISLERIRKTIAVLSETDFQLKTKSSGGAGYS